MPGKSPALLAEQLHELPEALSDRLRHLLPRLKQEYGAFTLWLVNPEALTTKRMRPVFLVELEKPLTLIQFIGLEQAIGRAVGKKVLLVQRNQYIEKHGEQAAQHALLISG